MDPAMWHFGFGGRDMERLVTGRERIYLDRFWNDLSRDPKRFDEAKCQHYAALYAQPGAMRAGFDQFPGVRAWSYQFSRIELAGNQRSTWTASARPASVVAGTAMQMRASPSRAL